MKDKKIKNAIVIIVAIIIICAISLLGGNAIIEKIKSEQEKFTAEEVREKVETEIANLKTESTEEITIEQVLQKLQENQSFTNIDTENQTAELEDYIVKLKYDENNEIAIESITKKKKGLSFSYEIAEIRPETLSLLIKAEDDKVGLDKIITPDNLEIKCNGKSAVAIDYEIELYKDYPFKVVNVAGETINQIVRKDVTYTEEGLLEKIEKLEQTQTSDYLQIEFVGRTRKQVYDEETYNLHTLVYNEDLILDGTKEIEGATLTNNVYEFGDVALDAATATEEAKSTVVVKVNGDLTINSGVTVTACRNGGYGGPKGLIIYCTGTLTNNGTITMTSRGAKAKGESLFLYRNADETYEYIPETGANGGESIYSSDCRENYRYNSPKNGNYGNTGVKRETGGGGSGAANYLVWSGAGAAGTSYSGGPGRWRSLLLCKWNSRF